MRLVIDRCMYMECSEFTIEAKLMNKSTHRKGISRFLVKVLLMLTILSSEFAFALSVGDWVSAELRTRELTVTGMKQRLYIVIYSGDIDLQMKFDSNARENIDAVYESYGVDAQEHLRWGALHRDEIEAWYAEHPEDLEALGRVDAEFDKYSEVFSKIYQ